MNWETHILNRDWRDHAGLVMGGVFGFGAGKLAQEFFRYVIPWNDVESLGFAVAGGATVGVLLGGGLGCFTVIIQFIFQGTKKTA